jgi:peptide deformylase
MQLPPIVQTGHPILRERAAEVTVQQIETPQFQQLVDTMIAVMRQAPGVGLAAPQIGVSMRVIVLEDTEQAAAHLAPQERREREREPFLLRVFVNPVLRPQGEESRLFLEGCLSIVGYAALVERHRQVEVSGLDRYGKPQTWLTHGWPARILQHEVDHLDGVLYVDRMLTRSFAKV